VRSERATVRSATQQRHVRVVDKDTKSASAHVVGDHSLVRAELQPALTDA
jgi:hypothetical protein